MKRGFIIFFLINFILIDVNIVQAFVPRQKNEPVYRQTEASNILSNKYKELIIDKVTNQNFGPFIYTNIDFNNLPIDLIDEIINKTSAENAISITLNKYYRPRKVSDLIGKIEKLNAKELSDLKSNNPQLSSVIEDVLSYSIDSVSTRVLFEEYLFLKENDLLSPTPIKNEEYQIGKKEYLRSMQSSIKKYLEYESKIFNAVLYIETIKAFERLNRYFMDIVEIYSEYEAPNSREDMKVGFEKLINSYDSKKNLVIVKNKMDEFLNQCNINRQNILESYFFDDISYVPQFSINENFFRKFNYTANPYYFDEFYNYKLSKERKNATAGIASSVVGLFTNFLGGMVVDAVSGTYKSSNISDIANKDYETRKNYIIDAYYRCLDDLSNQINKLEKNLRAQYNQNKKSFTNELSNKY